MLLHTQTSLCLPNTIKSFLETHILFAPSSGVISQFFGGTVKPTSLAILKHLEKAILHFSHDALCISFVLYLYQFAPVLQTKAVLEYQM